MTPFEFNTNLISVRTLKLYLFAVYRYHQVEFSVAQIYMMVNYMDKYESGIIYLEDIAVALEREFVPYVQIAHY